MADAVSNVDKQRVLQRLGRFKGTSVGVTGHTGFKGVWLIHLLNMLGAEISGFGLPPVPSSRNFFDSTDSGSMLTLSCHGNISDRVLVEGWLKKTKPEIVFHLAAQPLVRYSYDHPVETFSTNVMGLINLLEAIRVVSSVKAVVVVSSDKCYANDESGRPLSESDPLGGDDPYSASKACVEIISNSYRTSFFNLEQGCLLATGRAGNVIGGGDWAPDRLIPDIVRAIENNESIVVRNPSFTRPWQHVLDPLRGYLVLGVYLLDQQVKAADAWNFGPLADDSMTVMDLTREALSIWGKGKIDCSPVVGSVKESSELRLNVEKSAKELGFYPWWSVTKSIEETVEWYDKVVFADQNASEITFGQIEDYYS